MEKSSTNNNLDMNDSERDIQLIEAALAGDNERIEILVGNGANVNASVEGWNALMCATNGLHSRTVRLLLLLGANVHERTKFGNMNLLHILGESRLFYTQNQKSVVPSQKLVSEYLDIWKVLLEYGVSMSEENIVGQNPFHLVCYYGNLPAVSFLLSGNYVSDINAKTKNGATPLYFAKSKNFVEVIKVLESHGAVLDTTPTLLTFKQERNCSEIMMLPRDCIFKIFQYLQTAEDLCAVSNVCKQFYYLANLDELWEPLGSSEWSKQKLSSTSWKDLYFSWVRHTASAISSKFEIHDRTSNRPLILKIVLVGDSGVGKSALLIRYCDNIFNQIYSSTIGIDFKTKTLPTFIPVRLQIWDTSGSVRFRMIIANYYRTARGVCIVYDTTNLESFYNCQIWYKEVLQKVSSDCVFLAIGTKADLKDKRQVHESDAKAFFGPLNIPVIETSSKLNAGVDKIFTECVLSILMGGVSYPKYVPQFLMHLENLPQKMMEPPLKPQNNCNIL